MSLRRFTKRSSRDLAAVMEFGSLGRVVNRVGGELRFGRMLPRSNEGWKARFPARTAGASAVHNPNCATTVATPPCETRGQATIRLKPRPNGMVDLLRADNEGPLDDHAAPSSALTRASGNFVFPCT